MAINIVTADYGNPAHAAAVRMLLDAYACAPFGAGRKLDPAVLARLTGALAAVPGAFSLLAEAEGGFVGLANCFAGFSTFAAAPLVNIHDVYVQPGWRKRGVAAALLAGVDQVARARGCCAVTLEVAGDNAVARGAYLRAGFSDSGQLFWKKRLV